MSVVTLLMIAIAGVLLLLLMVIKWKIPPFVALLLVSLAVALASGIPAGEVIKVMTAGMGNVLGSVTMIIGLGAMLGRLIEHSGGAESLASYFTGKLGIARTAAALTIAAFILGIPVFFDVGFIILAPIIYGFAKVVKVSPLKFGLPVGAVMLTVHVVLPPHPGPVAAAGLLNADLGWLTLLGLVSCIPVAMVGYVTARAMNRRTYLLALEVLEQVQLAAPAGDGTRSVLAARRQPPSAWLITLLILIPIAIIMAGTLSATLLPATHLFAGVLQLAGSPVSALLIALALAFWLLALRRGLSLQHTSDVMSAALPTAAVVIMVTGAGGVFGKVLVESGVGNALSVALHNIGLPLLPAAFIISLALRASQGSATVAILTTGGLLAEAVSGLDQLHRVLITLAIGFGGLGVSHINDSGFWIVTKYLGLSVADGLKTWTVLTTICGITGFIMTCLLWWWL